eukprot:7390387-Prymnesium_polylepis.1
MVLQTHQGPPAPGPGPISLRPLRGRNAGPNTFAKSRFASAAARLRVTRRRGTARPTLCPPPYLHGWLLRAEFSVAWPLSLLRVYE